MKILYNQQQLNKLLLFGIAYVIIGFSALAMATSGYLVGFTMIGLLYIGQFIFVKNRGYVILTKQSIKTNGLFKKEIETKNIRSVTYFAGDYVIKTDKKELVINTNFVDQASMLPLKDYFDNLEIQA
ncbi:MAG: hypothetical protein CFE24_12090 [Flavobacterium sp. BFFFF2]|nr:MAG: hypothetical protein CFE24_12090 [Flavobacterium sp. BFFFF2]